MYYNFRGISDYFYNCNGEVLESFLQQIEYEKISIKSLRKFNSQSLVGFFYFYWSLKLSENDQYVDVIAHLARYGFIFKSFEYYFLLITLN